METRKYHVRDVSTITDIMQYEHCVQSIYFLGLEDFEGTVYLSVESDDYHADIELTNNTFIIGQPMTKFCTTYYCQIYGVVNGGEEIKLSKRFRMVINKSNNISGEAGEYPIDPNLVNGIDSYVAEKESEIDEYVEQVIESIPSDYTELNDEVDDLKNAFNEVVETTPIWSESVAQADITRLLDKQIAGNTGNVKDKTGWSILYWQATEDGFYDINLSYSQAQNLGRIYSSSDFSSATLVKSVTKLTPTHFQTEISAGQYLTFSSWSTTYTADIKKLEGNTYQIPQISEEITAEEANLFKDGWAHLPVENFSRNEWNGYNGTTSRNYRVKYNLPLQYSRDITLLASEGFYLSGYKSDGTSFGPSTTFDIPANTAFKVYVRRISENSGEMADIEEFANALTISTPLCDMERYKYTFTDVTMFPRIGISGDSFSAGGGIISGVRELTWGKNLERESGVIVDIYAKSGESIVGWNADETNGLPALLAGEECGLYWFAHGINGTSSDSALGTSEDMSANPKPQTFYGQYVYAIETVQRKFPQARIVIATIMGTGYSLYQTMYAKVNTAIRNIAEYCNIPIVDLASDDFYKSVWYDTHSLSNHPTAMLNAGIAHANRRILADTIMNNALYFIRYGDKYKYAVSCPPTTGGYISASPSVVASGETVTLSNTAYPGYNFVGYTSDDVTITNGTFVMPSHKVTINGVFEEE